MKIIGRYSLYHDNLETIPEDSLMVIETGTAVIDTYDRSALTYDSRCHIRLTTANGRFLFKAGYPHNDRNMSKELAEHIIEELAKNGCIDLRNYEGVMLYGGSEAVYPVEDIDKRYMYS